MGDDAVAEKGSGARSGEVSSFSEPTADSDTK
jgi:hypothetical protein